LSASRFHRTQVITYRHQTHALDEAPERVPSKLQSAAFCEPLLLHILHSENRLVLSLSWWNSRYADADHTFLGRRVAGALFICTGSTYSWCVVYTNPQFKMDSDTVWSARSPQIGRKLIEPDQWSVQSQNWYDPIGDGDLTLSAAQNW